MQGKFTKIMNFSVGKIGQNAFMSKTDPYKYEVGYAAVRTIQSGSTHNILSFQTYGYNYEYTQHRVASINLQCMMIFLLFLFRQQIQLWCEREI